MSRDHRPSDPCDIPRERLFRKQYRAALMGDGGVLPIEERLGRRLLRTIDPDSPEGRALLSAGQVVLRHEDDTWKEPIGEVLDALESQARRLLDDDTDRARRQLEETLIELRRHRSDYTS